MALLTSVCDIEHTKVSESKQSNGGLGWQHHLRVFAPILIVYSFLSFYRLDHQSLWLDEVLSLRVSSPNGSLFTKTIWFRGQGPLYFVLLHLWAKLSSSDFFLRALSALLGALSVCLIYATGLKLSNQRTAMVATILFATSPFLIWYSQEVRYITLMILTSLLATYTFQRAFSEDRLGWRISYVCSVILAFTAFLSNILLPLAHGLYLLWSPARRPFLRKWLACQVFVAIVFFFWANEGHYRSLAGYWKDLYIEFTDNGRIEGSSERSEGLSSGGTREFTMAALPYTFFAFSSGFSLGPSPQDLHWSRSLATLAPHAPILLMVFALFGLLFLFGLFKASRQPEVGRFLISWLVIPTIGAFGISALTDMTYNVRYVAMALPAFVLILAFGIVGFRQLEVQILLLTTILLLNGISLTNYYFKPRYAREDTRAAARYLETEAAPGDTILVVGSTTALGYYYKGGLRIVRWRNKVCTDSDSISECLQQLGNNHNHLWLVAVRSWQADAEGKVKAALDQLNTRIQYKQFPGVDIYCYQTPNRM